MSDWKREIFFCGNCREDTDCLCRHSNHERDSSGDLFICLKCHFEYSGYTCEWEAPYSRELEQCILESLEREDYANQSRNNI